LSGQSIATWGASAAMLADYGAGLPGGTSRGWIVFDVTNNMAEHQGLNACMPVPRVLFGFDAAFPPAGSTASVGLSQ